MNKRDSMTDILRVIGVFLVILAHVKNLPKPVLLFREFDVILLVFCSGRVYVKSAYMKYILKRVKRLLIPSYCAIAVAYAMIVLACILGNVDIGSFSYFDRKIIFETLTFQNGGMGYVWIVRIYLLIALLSGGINKVSELVKTRAGVIAVSVLGIATQEIFVFLFGNVNSIFVQQVVLYIIPYSLAYLAGMKTKDDRKLLKYLAISMAIVFSVSCLLAMNVEICSYKYPPQAIYTSWGILCSCILTLAISCIHKEPLPLRNVIEWISTNSMNVYYVHILPVIAMKLLETKISLYCPVLNNWLLQYVAIMAISLVGWYVVNKAKTFCMREGNL